MVGHRSYDCYNGAYDGSHTVIILREHLTQVHFLNSI